MKQLNHQKGDEKKIFLKVFSENLEYTEFRQLVSKVAKAKEEFEKLWIEKTIFETIENYNKNN